MIARMGRFLVAVSMLVICAAADAQQQVFTQQALDKILAPVALYPDSLLSQIIMAAAYPADIAAAADWSRRNRDFTGERAVRAVERYSWDSGVKLLVAFPQMLATMYENINWTRDLGAASLDQQAQFMETIQYLRRQAYAAGNLRTSDRINVAVRNSNLVIEFSNPEVVYVQYFNPLVVYGAWGWPAQPFYWMPWPGYYARPGENGVGWGPPVSVGRDFFFGVLDWQQRRIDTVNNSINRGNRTVPQSRSAGARPPARSAIYAAPEFYSDGRAQETRVVPPVAPVAPSQPVVATPEPYMTIDTNRHRIDPRLSNTGWPTVGDNESFKRHAHDPRPPTGKLPQSP